MSINEKGVSPADNRSKMDVVLALRKRAVVYRIMSYLRQRLVPSTTNIPVAIIKSMKILSLMLIIVE